MSYELTASVEFRGESFSPKKAEELTGLIFITRNEPNDIGTKGPYKNKPTPYGAASLEAPDEIDQFDRILWLANTLNGKVETIKQCGDEKAYFYIGYFYKDQCNLELTSEELKAISNTGLPFYFSCYDVSEDE